MKRGGPLQRRTPLAPVGRRVKAREAGWRRAKAIVRARAGGRCEARQEGCTGVMDHVHHRLPRSQGGIDDPEQLLAVCFPCHRWIHDNPKAARVLGLLLTKEIEGLG